MQTPEQLFFSSNSAMKIVILGLLIFLKLGLDNGCPESPCPPPISVRSTSRSNPNLEQHKT
jgi:hypothetical protein